MKITYKKQKAKGSASTSLSDQKQKAVLRSYMSYGFTILFLFSYCLVNGQISTREEPVSFKTDIPALKTNEQTLKVLPPLDISKIEKEDKEDEEKGNIPRFGIKHEVSYNLTNCGLWIDLPNGDKIWRLQISCPDATSISLIYDRFWLPEGAKYFIYSNDFKEYLGAFTSINNKGEKEDSSGFSTGLIRSAHVTLEYYAPKDVEDVGIISISQVVHGYRGFGATRGNVPCLNCAYLKLHDNAMCYPEFRNEIDAVVLIVVNGNSVCTGSLVNTTANEIHDRHFILTVEEWTLNANSFEFYWHYEHYACKPNQPSNQPPLISTQGASIVASSKTGNFVLLELHEEPGLAWDVVPYYLGWDRSGAEPTGEKTIIHHPSGDIKKMTSTTDNLFSAQALPHYWETDGLAFGDLCPPIMPHRGSEGAPLLNSNSKLVGFFRQLGRSACGDICCFYAAIFGKFSWAWDNTNAIAPSQRLRDWLDPIGTNPVFLEGRGCQQTIKLWRSFPKPTYHAVQNIISKQTIESGVKVSYKAGTEIVLQDGFHAQPGSNFSASIEELDCGGTDLKAPAPPGGGQNQDKLGINELANTFQLFPNPATHEITLKGEGITQVEIYDVTGRKLSSHHLIPSSYQQTLNVSHLVSGVYLVKIFAANNQIVTKRLVIIE
jgi:hypothetical protein